jgi:hypothetical protein
MLQLGCGAAARQSDEKHSVTSKAVIFYEKAFGCMQAQELVSLVLAR